MEDRPDQCNRSDMLRLGCTPAAIVTAVALRRKGRSHSRYSPRTPGRPLISLISA
jgi:hypothetical protein